MRHGKRNLRHPQFHPLECAGFEVRQAEAVLEAQREALSEVMEAQIATKADTARIEQELARTRQEVAAARAELAMVKWIVSSIGVGVLLLVIKSFLA